MRFILILLVSVFVSNLNGQGELEKALLDLYITQHKAIEAGDLETIKSNVTTESVKQIEEEEDQEFVLEMIQLFTPPLTSIKFGSCTIDGDSAELSATSDHEGENSDGTISFVKEEGDWKIAKVSWHSSQE